MTAIIPKMTPLHSFMKRYFWECHPSNDPLIITIRTTDQVSSDSRTSSSSSRLFKRLYSVDIFNLINPNFSPLIVLILKLKTAELTMRLKDRFVKLQLFFELFNSKFIFHVFSLTFWKGPV